ncbi:MAG: hypothetical protein QOF86_2730 [Baekduia sp.]|jgi:hypothetical protein|nr:hypothetical protein [Baekduia sp.]MEA2281212.1 hypothetical protein [Solirubrobacteraceae bacterium]
MTAARLLATVLVMAGVVAGCGSSDQKRFDLRTPPAGPPAPTTKSLTAKEPVTKTEERVIRGWSTQLRHGHVGRAARYFALPAVVANGFDPVKISTRQEARQFNKLLPCGAVVVKLERQVHHLVLTTFKLVNRTGPGAHPCGGGARAQSALRVQHGRITQWYRVPDPGSGAGSGTAQSSS